MDDITHAQTTTDRVDQGTYTNVGRHASHTLLIDHFVSSEEAKGIGVVLEGLDDPKNLVVISRIVSARRISTIQVSASKRRVDVKNHVDAGPVENGGTLIVVETGRQVVDADSVYLR